MIGSGSPAAGLALPLISILPLFQNRVDLTEQGIPFLSAAKLPPIQVQRRQDLSPSRYQLGWPELGILGGGVPPSNSAQVPVLLALGLGAANPWQTQPEVGFDASLQSRF